MKILYVADNRNRGNYGCRATSTALSMLIGEKHEVVGRVSGRYTHYDTGGLVFCKYFPSWVYKWMGKNKRWDRLRPVVHNILYFFTRKHYLFGPCDFVCQDMERMIANFKKCLPANKQLKEFDIESYDFDAMVVNGEGSFIFCTPPWRESLVISMCMYWALKLGKKVYFMNAMFSDMPNSPRNQKTLDIVDELFSRCEVVVARESISYDYVKLNLPSVKPILKPDALFTWYNLINDGHQVENGKYYLAHSAEKDESYFNQDFTKPYILVSGSSSPVIESNREKAVTAYSNLVKEIKQSYTGNVFLIQVCEGDDFLNDVANVTNTPIIALETPLLAAAKILANAQVFVSGRYHPAIMASQGGTPCVFMGSNSHKTYSLQNLLDYPDVKEYNVIPCEKDIREMTAKTLQYVHTQEEVRKRIKERAYNLYLESRTMLDLIK